MSKFGDFMKNQLNGLLGTVKELKIPVISQVASMATGLLGSHLQKSIINDKMSGAEREVFNLSAQEAQKARDWNLQMDNSKYQRQVTDMQKAGINPALAFWASCALRLNASRSAPLILSLIIDFCK